MFQSFCSVNQVLPVLLQMICFSVAWLIVFLLAWSTISATKKGITNLQTLHQIPCSQCQFFTGSYQLKCTVNPGIALTEDAINCPDHLPTHTAIKL